MKNIACLVFFLSSFLTSKAQMKTYKFEKVAVYEFKSDFYSNYVRILSTKDDSSTLLIVETPMGNEAKLNIGGLFYPVYSNDGKVFKLDIEDALEKNKYRRDTNPNIQLNAQEMVFKMVASNQTDSFENRHYPIYQMVSQDKDTTEISIDTTSTFSTVPFLVPFLKTQGLVYRIGTKIYLRQYGNIQDLLEREKEESDDDSNIKTDTTKQANNFEFQFDLNNAISAYKKAYQQKKLLKKSIPKNPVNKRKKK